MGLETRTRRFADCRQDSVSPWFHDNEVRESNERHFRAVFLEWMQTHHFGFEQGVSVVRHHPARPDHRRLAPTFPVGTDSYCATASMSQNSKFRVEIAATWGRSFPLPTIEATSPSNAIQKQDRIQNNSNG